MIFSQVINFKSLFAPRTLALLMSVGMFAISITAQKTFAPLANPDLDQCANGPAATPVACTGANWQNGNLNAGNSHYIEGQSVPYRAIFTGTVGSSIDFLLRRPRADSRCHVVRWPS